MRPDGVGARALQYWETRQAAAANNLANVSTPGFKAERVFAQMLDNAQTVARSTTDFTAGSVNPTGRPLDVAIVGEGFLVVDTPAGTRWMRGGSLSISPDGLLVDPSGRPVLADGGPIVLPPGEIAINDRGTIHVDGQPIARLTIERSGSDAPMMREGANLWVPTDVREEVPFDKLEVRQGALEDSNVNPVEALVEMIEIQRAYTAVQRSMVVSGDIMQTITTDIGRLG